MTTVFESALSHAQTPFINEPFTDFSREENKRAQATALEQVKKESGQTYPLIIGGQKVTGEKTFASINPSQPDQIIGNFAAATSDQTAQAIQEAAKTFETWKHVAANERAGYLFAAA